VSDTQDRSGASESASPIEVSVVIPCLNEEGGVGSVVEEAWQGILSSNRTGEVIVVDNGSIDRSAAIASEHGARVISEPRRGYGNAYLAGFAAARGSYIVMADADETYPLSELPPFIDRLEQGDDLVIGSRFDGTIHAGAMPFVNRYVGNRMITATLRVLCNANVSDAYCGMRAVRREALPALDLRSDGMELALEMVSKAFRRDLRVSEIPIDYFPRTGESKLHRFGDAWRSFRFMLLYSPSWLYLLPGCLMFVIGFLGMLAWVGGPVDAFGRSWQIHPVLFLVALTLVGAEAIQLGISARVYAVTHLGEHDALVSYFRPRIRLEHGLLAAGALMFGGLAVLIAVASTWAYRDFGPLGYGYTTAFGVVLLALGMETLLSSFFLSLLSTPATRTETVRVVMSAEAADVAHSESVVAR
jgi:glycosyltransferase involved in cell wall biosynthesis